MTRLTRAVVRELPPENGGRALLVGIEPVGARAILSFREKGTRRTYQLDLRTLFVRAVREQVELDRLQKRRRARDQVGTWQRGG
jgi:hypothetical protein